MYAYPKNVQINLSEDEKKIFTKMTERLKAVFRQKDGEYHG